MDKTEISIIEDHKVVRDNLNSFLALHDEFKVGLVCSSVEDFFDEVKHADGISCQVLLLDIGLPKMSGLDALPLLLAEKPELNVIILSSYEEEDMILKAICNGACSYISKKTSLPDIVDAIRVVIQGGSYMSPSIAREIFNHLMGGRVSKATILSDRQKEILEKMVDGKTSNDISAELFISPETVRSHIKKMYKVLHINNKSEAISMYLKGQIK